jgi:hypothetical protein
MVETRFSGNSAYLKLGQQELHFYCFHFRVAGISLRNGPVTHRYTVAPKAAPTTLLPNYHTYTDSTLTEFGAP